MGLELSGLCKRFGEKTAVEALSFSMNEPGVYGLIGTNGAGKTTTIRMILGMLPMDGGSALWDGQPVANSGLRYGYMPEERGIYMKTRVLTQLEYYGKLRGMSAKAARASALSWLERLGVAEYANVIAEKLSKGNQQKIQLISTLIHDPELIFLDEPFSGLDPLNTQMFHDLIQKLKSDGRYIIMSSHQMSVVEEYCREITLLHRGKALLQGNLQQIKEGYGYTRLVLSAPDEAFEYTETLGFCCLERRLQERVFSLPAQALGAQALPCCEALLRSLLERGWMPTKFLCSLPSLHEIFIQSVTPTEGEPA